MRGGGSPAPAPKWGVPADLEPSSSTSSSCLRVACDNAGNAIAVWEHSVTDTLKNVLWARYSTSTDNWTVGSAPLQDNVERNGDLPHVALAPGGSGLAVWQEEDGDAVLQVRARRYGAATGWDASSPLVDGRPEGNVNNPIVAVNAAGDGVAVWGREASVGGNKKVWASRFVGTSGTWTAAVQLSPVDDASHDRQRVALSANGDAFAVWRRNDPASTPQYTIMASRYDHGSDTWSSPVSLGTGDVRPWIVADGAGNGFVAYGDGTDVKVATYSSATGWGAPAVVSAPSAYAPRTPVVATGSDGALLVLWAQQSDTTNRILRYNRKAGGAWAGTQALPGVTANCVDHYLAPAKGGTFLAVWIESGRARSAAYRPGSGWGAPASIDNVAGGDSGDAFVAAGDDIGVAIWAQYFGDPPALRVQGNRIR